MTGQSKEMTVLKMLRIIAPVQRPAKLHIHIKCTRNSHHINIKISLHK
jgi:hypothetical protein